VEPTKLRTISPLVEMRPIGSTTRLTAATATKARKGQLIEEEKP
jgi:hypothetical protein